MSGSPPRIIVLGIGNPDRGDDGLGPQVAAHLAGRLPDGVTLAVRSSDLLAVLDDWKSCDALVCVDAATPMEKPGRIHRFDASTGAIPAATSLLSSHGFGLAEALALARELGMLPRHIVVYAVEGAAFDGGGAMTPAVAAAAHQVADTIVEEISGLVFQQIRGNCSPDSQSTMRPPPKLVDICTKQ